MNTRRMIRPLAVVGVIMMTIMLLFPLSFAADHNDPNAVNSIFADIPISAADLYGMFGYPSDDKSDGEKVVVQLTFASIPQAGTFDPDMLYRINMDPDIRIRSTNSERSLSTILDYAKGVTQKYLNKKSAEIRVTFNLKNQARVDFLGFPGEDFHEVIDTNKILTITTPNGHAIKAFLGGRDDPFFNDLPGFFRSINYAPQFYHVPYAMTEMRELEIPKTLIELEENTLFNFDARFPTHGQGMKKKLPEGPYAWQGQAFKKDQNGNFRFVYSGRDAQAGMNVNALVFEIPLAFLSESPTTERIVRTWGESWVLKASSKIDTIPDTAYWREFWKWLSGLFSSEPENEGQFKNNLDDYKRVDTVGVPFLDAALSSRENERQVGANNLKHARTFVKRFGHLGWGFGPSITALGLETCFDHDHSPVSIYKIYNLATAAFPRSKKCFFQELPMPDHSWNNSGKNIPLKRTFEIFIPNVTAIDMDTTGTWPFGRRLEDQVATRFLSLFLDMKTGCGGQPCNIETLQDQALWDDAKIVPKTPPNPIHNDKPFLQEFPYLAEPW